MEKEKTSPVCMYRRTVVRIHPTALNKKEMTLIIVYGIMFVALMVSIERGRRHLLKNK
jgi:hypothetical protein